MKKTRGAPVYHAPPRDDIDAVDADEARAEFGRRLQAAMMRSGLSQTDLAAKASQHLPEGDRLGRDSISKYVNGKQMPNPPRLAAIAKVLKVTPDSLVPSEFVRADPAITPVSIREMENGNVWLRINQEVSWDVAMKVLQLIKADDAD